ncbi:hypothetical protein V492_05726 [Pseudogymnoascus sp. VKM F-4246]|nr:hypothetical protein V492_05726 [Pseudogymnoascus sp. VKM F-4246]
MAPLATFLRSIGLRPRSTGPARDEARPHLPQDEKQGLQVLETASPALALPKEKKKPRPKPRREKLPSKSELNKQLAEDMTRTAAASKRTTEFYARSAVAAKRIAKLIELLVARGDEQELHRVSCAYGRSSRQDGLINGVLERARKAMETWPPSPLRENRELRAEPRSGNSPTDREILQQTTDSSGRLVVSMEKNAVFAEGMAEALERVAHLLELIVAGGDELELLRDVSCSSKG